MKPLSIDKSAVLLVVIIAIIVSIALAFGLSMRSEAAGQAAKGDRILNILLIFESEGRPRSSELILFYPATGKGALLDIPSETGLIIKSLNRVDRIDALYDTKKPKTYIDEVASLLSTDIAYYIILDSEGLSDSVDLLEGLELFIPEAVSLPGPPGIYLPSGALIVDGDKALQFSAYINPDESAADHALNRQKLAQSYIKRLGEKSSWLKRSDAFQLFKRCIKTNLPDASLRLFFSELAGLDADRLLLQRITGSYRTVDGKQLLFPYYDGELVRDIVKQTLNALAVSGTGGTVDKIFTVEILNGTPSKGLAKKTAEIFQSFGYDVVSVGNADKENYEKTIILDKLSNPDAAKNVASVIRCSTITDSSTSVGQTTADFIVILGDDFDGRYCAH